MKNKRANMTAVLAETNTDQGTDRAGRMATATHQGLSLHGHRQREPLEPDHAPEVSPRPGRWSRPAPSDSCLPGADATALPGQASAGALRSALHLGRAECGEGRAQNPQVTGKRAPLTPTDTPATASCQPHPPGPQMLPRDPLAFPAETTAHLQTAQADTPHWTLPSGPGCISRAGAEPAPHPRPPSGLSIWWGQAWTAQTNRLDRWPPPSASRDGRSPGLPSGPRVPHGMVRTPSAPEGTRQVPPLSPWGLSSPEAGPQYPHFLLFTEHTCWARHAVPTPGSAGCGHTGLLVAHSQPAAPLSGMPYLSTSSQSGLSTPRQGPMRSAKDPDTARLVLMGRRLSWSWLCSLPVPVEHRL